MIRVALIGPESTGKSTLCEQLSNYFKTVWVEEFSRSYISKLDHSYGEKDILHCIEHQIEQEKIKTISANKILFTDNESINGKVWLLDKSYECPAWLEDEISKNPYDLYLLTFPDLQFVADEVRENGDRRFYFYLWYKKLLNEYNFNYKVIDGLDDERFQNALREVKELLEIKNYSELYHS